MFLPFAMMNYLEIIYPKSWHWLIPIGLTWSNKVVSHLQTFIGVLTVIANDMLSTKRLWDYKELKSDYNQKIGEKRFREFEVVKGKFALLLKNVHLTIKGNQIFTGLTMRIKKGDKVAIIGPTGSGKHSFFKLILGLYKPDKLPEIKTPEKARRRRMLLKLKKKKRKKEKIRRKRIKEREIRRIKK